MRRRRVESRLLLAVGAVLLMGTGISGCSNIVTIDSPAGRLSGSAARACHRLIARVPERVAGQPFRPVQPSGALGAAWGDPAIVLRCGVPKPAALTASSSCFVANGVGWFATQDGQPADGLQPVTGELVFTTVGRTPSVEVSVPPDYQPASDALVDLAPALKGATSQQRPCV